MRTSSELFVLGMEYNYTASGHVGTNKSSSCMMTLQSQRTYTNRLVV